MEDNPFLQLVKLCLESPKSHKLGGRRRQLSSRNIHFQGQICKQQASMKTPSALAITQF